MCPLKVARKNKVSPFDVIIKRDLCLVVCAPVKPIEPNQQIKNEKKKEKKKTGLFVSSQYNTHSLGASGRFVPADLSEYRG